MPVGFMVRAPLAMFRKWWTTTSSISYDFPPPTAIAGLISAILGFPKGENNKANYWNEMKGGQVAIVIESFRRLNMGINLINTKKDKKYFVEHSQVMHQFVRDVSYIIFYKGPKEEQLYKYLENSWSKYTPYLGVAYALTQLTLLGIGREEEVRDYYVDSVFPLTEDEDIPSIDVIGSSGVFSERMDYVMDESRRRRGVINVIYAKGPIYFKEKVFLSRLWMEGEVSEKKEYYVKWFPRWD